MKKIIFILPLLILAFVLPIKAHATSCAWPEDPIKEYDIAFKGKVVKSSKEKEEIKGQLVTIESTKFDLIEKYKGTLPDQIDIYHFPGDGMFGISYQDDATYLIYADLDEQNRYTTGLCSVQYQFPKENKPGNNPAMATAPAELFKAQADVLKKLVSEHPDITYFSLKQAEFHEENNDLETAANIYKNVIESKNKLNDNKAINGLGRTLYKMGKYEEALKTLEYVEIIKIQHDPEAIKYYQASLLKLKMFEKLNGQKIDFSGLEFTNIDLSNLDLSGSNFSKAKFSEVKINNSKFENVDFSGALFSSLEAKNTSFKNSTFQEAEMRFPNFENVDFSGAIFTNAELAQGIGKNVNFTNSNFRGAKFFFKEYDNIDLTNADFTNAVAHRLNGMNLNGTKLDKIQVGGYGEESSYEGVDLSGFDLSGSDLRGANLKNAKLVNADLSGANLTWTYNGPSNLQGADLTGSKLDNALMLFAFYDCNTKFPNDFKPESRYMIPVWENCDSKRPAISLNGLTLPIDGKGDANEYNRIPIHDRKTWGENPWLQNVDLHGIDLRGSNLGKFECTNCDLRDANFSNLKIVLRADKSDLRGAIFDNAEILGRGSILNEADVRGVDLSVLKPDLKRTDKEGRKQYLPQVQNIKYDSKTIWPEGFSPDSTGMMKSE